MLQQARSRAIPDPYIRAHPYSLRRRMTAAGAPEGERRIDYVLYPDQCAAGARNPREFQVYRLSHGSIEALLMPRSTMPVVWFRG